MNYQYINETAKQWYKFEKLGHRNLSNKCFKTVICRYSADMKENANKFVYFRYLKYGVFLHTDCK